ncbi:hypothetical protein GOV04_02505 [Candidatus Woesearchaeota archaeon]|nr:hypothetical protein [Candidatus Woesearchaeota archaeon]
MDKKLEVRDGSVVLKVNPEFYPLDIIYSAAYVFLDKAYVLLDGDLKKEILVKLQPKQKQDLEKLGGEFLNELINYADYKHRAAQTKTIREYLLQRALFTNDPSIIPDDDEEVDYNEILNELEEDDEELDDPEGIAVPWEEKYGQKDEKKD